MTSQQIATTQAQSERLIACGISPDTADMNWTDFIPDEPVLAVGEPYYRLDDNLNPVLDSSGKPIYECFPAWSLASLLALLPTKIDGGYWLTIQDINDTSEPYPYYGIAYFQCKWDDRSKAPCSTITTVGHKQYFKSRSLIEAAVQMLEWLTSNGYPLRRSSKRQPSHQ